MLPIVRGRHSALSMADPFGPPSRSNPFPGELGEFIVLILHWQLIVHQQNGAVSTSAAYAPKRVIREVSKSRTQIMGPFDEDFIDWLPFYLQDIICGTNTVHLPPY